MTNIEAQENKHLNQNHTYSIIVNGRNKTVNKHKLSYIEVVQLAYPNEQPSANVVFTITYSDPHGKDGSLAEGDHVNVKEGMIFNVKKTDQS